MFYNVSKTVFAYLGALICLDIGFGLAFMITHQCAQDEDGNAVNPFQGFYRYIKMNNALISRLILNRF